MTQLHLAAPHLCPACNVVHYLNKERERLDSVLAKKDHIGTFLPIASNGPSNPARCYGLFGTGGSVTIILSENSIPSFVVSSTTYPYTFTIGRTGWYHIGVMWQYGIHSSTNGVVYISRNGTVVAQSNATDTSNHDAGTGFYYETLLNAGDTITITSSQGNAPYTFTGSNTFSFDFVPTPQYRK